MRLSADAGSKPFRDAVGTQAPPRVNITIDRLVLRGFSADQSVAIGAQLQSELARFLSDPHIVVALGQSRDLHALRVAKPLNGASETRASLGAQAAASIVRGMRP